MRTYKIQLTFKSPILTPLHADIIFGHLCWVLAYQKRDEGDDGLQEFLQLFKEGKPPFVISDGFPTESLPIPLSAEFVIDEPIERKELKSIDYIGLEDFQCVRKAEKYTPRLYDRLIKNYLTPHNTINRITNATLAEGGVYSLEEIYIPRVTIYVKTISIEWKDRVGRLFKELSEAGFGRKKSIGKGQFQVESMEPFDDFDEIENANGFVTLSNFCPAENDPSEGLCKIFVKYGKLGEEYTYCGNPFKKPLLMIKTGSVFKTNGKPKEFYGRMIENISALKPEVVQYAYAFSVPIRYPEIKT